MLESQRNGGEQWLSRGIILLLTLVAANLLAWRTIEPDLWGHIQYGEDWLSTGTMPRTATHTYSTPDQPWVNHENLFELAVAMGQRTVGGLGLMIFKCIAGLWLLWVMVRTAQARGVAALTAVVAMVPVAWGLSEFWLARPQLFSFLCCGLMFLAMERAFPSWAKDSRVEFRWLWLCVPLMTIWTNSHGGFAAGLCVLIAILGLRSLELLHRVGTCAWPVIAHFSVISVFAVLAVLVNPYGYELPYWMIVSLSQPRPEVSEWANILDGGVTAVPFAVLTILTLLSLKCTRCRRDWVELIVLGLIAVQTLGHVRHLAFFAIAFGFWMPQHLESLWHRLVERRPTLGTHHELSPKENRWLMAEFGVVAVLLLGLLGYSFFNFGVDRSRYPVSAFEFMAEENIHGRLVVTFDWAQYALAALAPTTTVGFDGRYDTCYPQAVVDMNFDLLFGSDLSRRHRGVTSGPVDSNRVLEFGDPSLVMMDRIADLPAVQFIDQHNDWTRLYSDGRAILWGRKSVFDNPQLATYVPEHRRRETDRIPAGIAAWPGFPGRRGRDAFSPVRAAEAARQRAQHSTLISRETQLLN